MSTESTTFVLVHGGMHGGWCWRRVGDALRAAGHRVFTPTLTGLGERAHLLTESVSVQTWIADIVAVLECEELSDVVLVGHSFGGIVISGVADRIPERIHDLVFLDGALVPSGSTMFAEMPADEAEKRETHAAGRATIQPFPAAAFAITDPADAAWVERRLTPHPIRTFADRLHLDHPLGNGLRCTYLACTDPFLPSLDRSRQRAKSTPGWRWREIPTGHDAMITAPGLVTAALLDVHTSHPVS